MPQPKNRLRGRSAIADDGALVLSCSTPHFRHPGPGVLRYEDALSRDTGDRPSAALLGEHLVLARDGQLPVRMIVVAESGEGKPRYNIYAAPRRDRPADRVRWRSLHCGLQAARRRASGARRRPQASRLDARICTGERTIPNSHAPDLINYLGLVNFRLAFPGPRILAPSGRRTVITEIPVTGWQSVSACLI